MDVFRIIQRIICNVYITQTLSMKYERNNLSLSVHNCVLSRCHFTLILLLSVHESLKPLLCINVVYLATPKLSKPITLINFPKQTTIFRLEFNRSTV